MSYAISCAEILNLSWLQDHARLKHLRLFSEVPSALDPLSDVLKVEHVGSGR